MHVNNEQFRFYTFTRLQLGEDCRKIHADLQAVYGTDCVSYRTVCRWVKQLGAGRVPSDWGNHAERALPARNEQNIAYVKRLIEEDPHSTVRELSEACELSIGTINNILHKDLHMRKLAARWVPHLLSDDQKQQRVACSHKLLDEFEPNGPKRLCDLVTGDESWLTFYGIPNNRYNAFGLALTETDQLFFAQDSRVASDCFLFFSTRKALWQLTFCLRNQQSLPPTIPKLCSRKL